jgi:hypothetical protein
VVVEVDGSVPLRALRALSDMARTDPRGSANERGGERRAATDEGRGCQDRRRQGRTKCRERGGEEEAEG